MLFGTLTLLRRAHLRLTLRDPDPSRDPLVSRDFDLARQPCNTWYVEVPLTVPANTVYACLDRRPAFQVTFDWPDATARRPVTVSVFPGGLRPPPAGALRE